MTSSKVDVAVLEELRAIVGPDHVHIDPDTIAAHARDETEDLVYPPEVVVAPGTTGEVARIMQLASKHRIPVTPRGAGTGLSGGALPVHGGIGVWLGRMDRILEIDTGNQMAVVEAGVVTQRLQEEVAKHGLYYPPDPASRGSCTMGGNIAEDAGGPHAVKYGVTRDWITGLEVVLADGTVITTGGKIRKDVSGYNLTQLFVGSEGTLGIVTRAVVELIPMPSHRRALVACFEDAEGAARAIVEIYARRIDPSVVELMEGEAWRAGSRHVGKSPLSPDHGAYLLLEVDGRSNEEVDRDALAVGQACESAGAGDVVVAESPGRQADLWSIRAAIGEAVRGIAPYKEEDTVVPRRSIPDLIEAVRGIIERHGLRAICYGHAGDGNLHVNILKESREDRRPLEPAIREIFGIVARLGGKISGEHGIGLVQREYLPIAHDAGEIEMMRRIKRAFDPEGILNPGKIFPDD